MKELNFRYSESGSKPALIDFQSSPTHVYLRKDIEEFERTQEYGRTDTMYRYQEACIPKDEYIEYQYEKQLLQEEVINFLLNNTLSNDEGE